jgi:hypothetical protein
MSVELSSLTLDAAGTCSQGDFCRGLSRSVEVCQVAVELSRAILSSRLSSSCRVSCRVVEARAQSQISDSVVSVQRRSGAVDRRAPDDASFLDD